MSSGRRAGRWRAGVMAGALILGAAACGGVGDGAASISAGAIARAAESSSDEDTARFAMAMEIAGQELEITGQMAMDGSAMATSFAMPGIGDFEQRLVDGRLYLRMPGARAEVGTEWVHFDVDGLLPEQRSRFDGANGADPLGSLRSVAGADGEVETLGVDELRGGRATHYRVVIDADTALERLREQGIEPTEQQLEGVEAMNGEPMDVWIDEDGRMAKMTFRLRLPQGTARVSMEVFDYGIPLSIDPPPADATTDITERVRSRITV
ncbi:MAG: hypothetical protein FJW95_06505 [Actinobacteria bacterium]|nr:hypothetical protein [Actinomycetota bacterium]